MAAGLFLAFVALLGAAYFYGQSLVSDTTPIRVPIPNAEIEANDTFALWQIPKHLRTDRWHRTPVRLYESGRPFSMRGEDELFVIDVGEGSFCIQDEYVYFSTPDGTNPLRNGRRYEIEIHRLSHRKAILAGLSLAVSAVLIICALPCRRWFQHILQLLSCAEERMRCISLLGLSGLSVAALFVVGAMISENVSLPLPIDPGAVLQKADGSCTYFLPRWIRTAYPWRANSSVFYEDQKPLNRLRLSDSQKTSLPPIDTLRGSYMVEKHTLCFWPSESSASSMDWHSYRLEVPLINRSSWLWWSLFFGITAGSLLLYRTSKKKNAILSPSFERAAWWIPLLVAGLLKLWVIAGNDVMGQQADASGYAQRANMLIWGPNSVLPGHPIGFSLVTGLVAQFGIPWRLALEFFFLITCYYLARGVVKLAGSKLAGLILFIFMVWHPWSFLGFNDFMPDPLTMVTLGALLAVLFSLLNKLPGLWTWTPLVGAGFLLFIWESTRDEEPLLYVSYAFFVVLVLVCVRSQPGGLPLDWQRLALKLAFPLLLMFCLESASRVMMYTHFGVYAKSGTNLPGLKKLLKTLYRVQPEQTLRYAPVTRESLRAACEVSPSLKPFRDALLDPNAPSTIFGQASTKVPGEFGPYLYWLLLGNVPGDARRQNQIMFQAASEIQTALDDGRLPKRRACWPLDPNWRLWVPDLPRCFKTWFAHGTFMASPGEPWGTYRKPLLQHSFDQAANRRAANIYHHLFLAQGAVVAPPGAIDSVAIVDFEGRWRAASMIDTSNWWDNGQSFEMRFPVETPDGATYQLLFLRQGQVQSSTSMSLVSQHSSGISQFTWTNESKINLPEGRGTFSYEFQAGLTEPSRQARRIACEQFLQNHYRSLLTWALAIVFLCMFFVPRWAPVNFRASSLCLVLAMGWFTARAAFYGLLVANMEFGQTRYMRCVSPLFILILFLVVMLAGAALGKWMSQKARIISKYSEPQLPLANSV